MVRIAQQGTCPTPFTKWIHARGLATPALLVPCSPGAVWAAACGCITKGWSPRQGTGGWSSRLGGS